MVKLTQVTFIDRSSNFINADVKRYYIITLDETSAIDKAIEILSKEKHANKYEYLFTKIVEAHEV